MIEPVIKNNLLTLATQYGTARGKTLSAVGREVYGKAGFFEDLMSGKQGITLTRIGKMFDTFAKLWPKGTPWPRLEPVTFDAPTRAKRPQKK